MERSLQRHLQQKGLRGAVKTTLRLTVQASFAVLALNTTAIANMASLDWAIPKLGSEIPSSISIEAINRVADPLQYDSKEMTKLFSSQAGMTKGVVEIIHGLNMRPSRMNEIVQVLQKDGYDVLRVSLTGHRGNYHELVHVTRAQWLKDAYSGYLLARKLADQKKVPLDFLGYSLGGLVVEDLLNTSTKVPVVFSKVVLFAPVISVNPKMRAYSALRALPSWFFKNQGKPKFAGHRLYSKVPVAAYKAIDEELEAIEHVQMRDSNLPTMVYVHPEDGTVYYAGIIKLIEDDHLSRWTMHKLSLENRPRADTPYHYITNAAYFSPQEWSEVMESMLLHLGQ